MGIAYAVVAAQIRQSKAVPMPSIGPESRMGLLYRLYRASRACLFKAFLPKFAKNATLGYMTTMNISLPDGLKAFVDERVQSEGFGTSSEYVRALIRRDKDRAQFREHLLAGVRSGVAATMDASYFATLRRGLAKPTRKSA